MPVTVEELPLELVHPNPDNIRADVEEDESLERLTAEIGSFGVISPIIVYPSPDQDGAFVVQEGHRRRLASLRAGKTTIPCIVRKAPDRGALADVEVMLTTGRNHKPLTVAEEAHGFQRMLDLGLSESTIAKKFRQPRKTIRTKAKITQQPDEVQRAYAYGHLSLEDAAKIQELEEAGDTQVLERVLEKFDGTPFGPRNVDYTIRRAQQDIAEQETRDLLQGLGAEEAPMDVAWSGKYSEVQDALSESQHAALGHVFRILGEEVTWWEPKKKPAAALSEEEKEAKRRLQELKRELQISAETRRAELLEACRLPNTKMHVEADRQMLLDLVWFTIRRHPDKAFLAEATGVELPENTDEYHPDHGAWLDQVKEKISDWHWGQIVRLAVTAENWEHEKRLRKPEGFERDRYDGADRAAWLRTLREGFGHVWDDAEAEAITRWEDANPDHLTTVGGTDLTVEVDR
ncbi:ParB/RepB/Spo0J family partition protein [Nesterenkonia sp. K-15-9-6]|uniref:ParB/RepB/Spo0J family partition protein n=1 Tax=Nesterenkonia sp. K-15-9-6 TaxID=3093918 RepID=UPI004044B73F